MWVDPATGSIIDQTESQTRVQADNGQTLSSTSTSASPTRRSRPTSRRPRRTLEADLADPTVPLVGGLVGLLALIGGLILWRTSRNRVAATTQDSSHEDARARPPGSLTRSAPRREGPRRHGGGPLVVRWRQADDGAGSRLPPSGRRRRVASSAVSGWAMLSSDWPSALTPRNGRDDARRPP